MAFYDSNFNDEEWYSMQMSLHFLKIIFNTTANNAVGGVGGWVRGVGGGRGMVNVRTSDIFYHYLEKVITQYTSNFVHTLAMQIL